MKKVTNMNNIEAKNFFLKSNNYFNNDLPQYFNFDNILKEIDNKLKNKNLSDYNIKECKIYNIKNNINYKILHNKNGNYDLRTFELIHPALYIDLVNTITKEENWDTLLKRINILQGNEKIICCGMPGEVENYNNTNTKESILNWWNTIEQESIKLSMKYQYICCTDISNFYPSIYTHTIPWAIHGKKEAKDCKNKKNLLGNYIDKKIQHMSYGQTNGIPQGSVLMDFIAEIILSYADYKLSENLSHLEYKILRYRDDYKIFTNNTMDLKLIFKELSKTLQDLNLRLNANKTFISDDIITSSIKPDKLYCIENYFNEKDTLQKKLLFIRHIGKKFPNSGSLIRLLTELYKREILKIKNTFNNTIQSISIVLDIMKNNPRTYPICSAILSKLLSLINRQEQKFVFDNIRNQFEVNPNIDYLEIWLQRLTIKYDRNKKYNTTLCKKIYDNSAKIWNWDWTNINKNENLETKIFHQDILENMTPIINPEEVDAFINLGY